jgi:glycerol-3-phosphate dehydrogenase
MAERVVDEAADLHDLSVQKSTTEEQPLVGGDVVVDERNHLIDLYGSEAKDVLGDGGGVSAEVRQAVTREGAICLEDYWVRRVPRAFFDLDGGISVLQEAANEMGDLLGWDEAKKKKEIASCEERHNIENGLFTSHGETNA